MTDAIRVLNDAGLTAYSNYLAALGENGSLPPPWHILTNPATSDAAPFNAQIEKAPAGKNFGDRFTFGSYLSTKIPEAQAVISRAHRLWSWLSLYYFDQICPVNSSGERESLAVPAYILDREFSYKNYYRHLVRTPWLAVAMHGDNSKALLMPLRPTKAPLAQRGELIEQIASRQHLFSSTNVVAAAHALYFDNANNHPKPGAGGSKGGSPRRLAAVLNQFDLTYDLGSVSPTVILERLPKEFSKWKPTPETDPL